MYRSASGLRGARRSGDGRGSRWLLDVRSAFFGFAAIAGRVEMMAGMLMRDTTGARAIASGPAR